ncbi:hypothetical protein PR048_005152 [Dryococelus australis]|uniref:Uncharacterized protein n=1 Tax=Dryococelus australis TaxID=614101 RepID=A0ABQ9I7G2_9NEOP|nr:hypothetical protein PR048_005152 [Dryococelus australis]
MGTVMFSEEAKCTNSGNANLHDMYYWSQENPYSLRQVEHYRQWIVNIWYDIIFTEGPLNGEKYKPFLGRALPWLEDVALNTRQVMWNQHNRCPAHQALIARNELHSCSVLPECLPDLTPLDYFLWVQIKGVVFQLS